MEVNDRVVLVNLIDLVGAVYEKYNPKNTEGTVICIDKRFNPIEVMWDNGIKNSYSEKNLELI